MGWGRVRHPLPLGFTVGSLKPVDSNFTAVRVLESNAFSIQSDPSLVYFRVSQRIFMKKGIRKNQFTVLIEQCPTWKPSPALLFPEKNNYNQSSFCILIGFLTHVQKRGVNSSSLSINYFRFWSLQILYPCFLMNFDSPVPQLHISPLALCCLFL